MPESLISIALMAIVVATVLVAVLIGHRSGLKRVTAYTDPFKSHIVGIQSSMLGLLSFLLGFTFSIAIHHFDERSLAMKEEANAIGTVYLRAQSLPDTVKATALATLEKYVDVRVKAGAIPLDQYLQREPLLREAGQLRTALWDMSMQALEEDGRVTTSGYFIQAMNDLIDSYGTRDEALNRHIPVLFIWILTCLIILSAGLIGYTSGINHHRPSRIAALFLIAIAVLTYVMTDLDQPRRGMIQVSQKNMLDLQMEIRQPH